MTADWTTGDFTFGPTTDIANLGVKMKEAANLRDLRQD